MTDTKLAFLKTRTFPVFSPPTYVNPAFILLFYLSFILLLSTFTNLPRTDTCNNPNTLRDSVTGRNRNRNHLPPSILLICPTIFSYLSVSLPDIFTIPSCSSYVLVFYFVFPCHSTHPSENPHVSLHLISSLSSCYKYPMLPDHGSLQALLQAKCVKRFELSNGLDTALYINYLYLFFTTVL